MLLAVSKATGQTSPCIPRIATGLGGGLGVGEVCGALSGGVLALSCFSNGAQADKQAIKLNTKKYVQQFAEHNGALRCAELISANSLNQQICSRAVSSAVRLLFEA